MNNPRPPVITIDGPSGTGKGTLAQLIAQKLQWHFLDSGSLYRVLAYAALQLNVDLTDEQCLQQLALTLDVRFDSDFHPRIILNTQDVTDAIRSEKCGNIASQIAALPKVRLALLERQRAFRQWPGLVTDGRDMGTVVFPDAQIKFFLFAEREERAKRRYKQLKQKGIHASLNTILHDLEQRDQRDTDRLIAPMKSAADAILIDTTHLSVEQVADFVLNIIHNANLAVKV